MATISSSTSTSSTNSSSSNALRITGMASGIDTDATVKALMQPYQLQLDKMNQAKQTVQWKQDAYRDTMTNINTFKSTFYDVLNTDSYMLSKNSYSGFDTSATDATTGLASTALSVKAGTGAIAGNYSVDFSNGGKLAAAAGVISNGKIQTAATPAVDASSSTLLSDLGITSTSISITYDNGSGGTTPSPTTVNVAITSGMTLSGLAQAINTATSSGVVARFSELTGKFSVQTASTGANTKISITDSSTSPNIINKLNLGGASDTSVSETTAGYKIAPADFTAKITPPGETTGTTVTKSSNIFSIDSVTYNFTAPSNTNVTLTANVQKSYDKVKAYIDKYNDMIDKISTKLSETKQKDYPPLTDAQKSSMTADQITSWETKAKQGLLRNDSTLSSMLTSMRSAFFQTVSGAGISLSEIGLSTSSDYTQGGKIIINETKLKDALQTRGDQVASIFSKVSTSQPSYSPDLTLSQRATRTSEEGIFQRINDILQDSTRTTRNSSGKKGTLVEEAGVVGDYTEYSNTLTNDLNQKTKDIAAMVKKMSDKQTAYYTQFSKLEATMNTLNTQSSWLSQQISSGVA